MYLAKVEDLITIGKNSNNSGRTMNNHINICVSDAPKYVNIGDLFELCENDRYNMYKLGQTAQRYIKDSAKEYAEVIHAYWKHIRDEQAFYNCENWNYYKCSHCNYKSDANWNYCPKCGAKMDMGGGNNYDL